MTDSDQPADETKERKDPRPPTDLPGLDEMQNQLQEFFRKLGSDSTGFAAGPGGMSVPGAARQAKARPQAEEEREAQKRQEAMERIRGFDLRPRDVRDYLDRFVIRQDEAKKVLAVAVCDHYNHVRRCLEGEVPADEEYAKQNIVILGPTGVGKTYLMRCVARLIGVPFVKADATKFSETGYVGHDVEDLVRDLVRMADGDVELAEYGIVYVDEIDKIAMSKAQAGGRDVSGRGVQINLLKLMEETEVSRFGQSDLIGQMQSVMGMMQGSGEVPSTINTKHVLFIVSGAFGGLSEIVRKRMGRGSIGFRGTGGGNELNEAECMRNVRTADLIQYGFEPEFVGRLPVRVACDPLSAEDLEEILRQSESSILRQYQADLQGYGIRSDFTGEALRAVAEKAHGENTGARGLMTVLERVLRGFKFELPGTGIDTLEIGRETIADPATALQELLAENADRMHETERADIVEFARRFQTEHGIAIHFTDEAEQRLLELAREFGKTTRTVCEQRFRDLPYGLSLLARHDGCHEFEVDRALVDDPDDALAARIKEEFQDTAEDSSPA